MFKEAYYYTLWTCYGILKSLFLIYDVEFWLSLYNFDTPARLKTSTADMCEVQ